MTCGVERLALGVDDRRGGWPWCSSNDTLPVGVTAPVVGHLRVVCGMNNRWVTIDESCLFTMTLSFVPLQPFDVGLLFESPL